ncbi:MAG TPA: Xaa-Pro peptidase family protein [Candidatus Hydrogenedentes bacterium]|nr:Xaa-Pro peptidase family protein [Candidatus Hydrogenedentota bacterium]HPG66792.1 Xaa-Pro peptidase family protein [Candidatus Hydrogenedentota bacterium]
MHERLERLRARMAAAECDGFVSLSPAANQYLAGFTGTASVVIVTEDEALFLCDFRYTEQAAHQVTGFSIHQVTEASESEAGRRLTAHGARRVVFDPTAMTVAGFDHIEETFIGALIPDADMVASLRVIKSADEIERIRAAVKLAEAVLTEEVQSFKEGLTERELAARFEYGFKMRGASEAAFKTIALFGAHTSVVHGEPDGRPLEKGHAVLVDFGCRLDGYCSDLTRTYVYSKIPGAWFEEVYHLTLAAQQRALESIRPGMTCREVDAVARDVIREAGYGERFGHGLGHGVGIDVHEQPRLGRQSDTVLQVGMVVTVEPGIYLPGQGGVRIEDLVVVTENGCECLSTAPKSLRVLEG